MPKPQYWDPALRLSQCSLPFTLTFQKAAAHCAKDAVCVIFCNWIQSNVSGVNRVLESEGKKQNWELVYSVNNLHAGVHMLFIYTQCCLGA